MKSNPYLNFLERMADGLTTMFGNNCEVVIHDMKHKDIPIVYIVNGHVTGRKLGEKRSVLGGRDFDKFYDGVDLINVKAFISDTKTLKSSTFHFSNGEYHYALGINYDYTPLSYAKSILEDLVSVGQDLDDMIQGGSNSEDMLEDFFEDALKLTGKPVPLLSKMDRIKIISKLEDKGAFTFKKSIPFVSERLGVSRYTVYNYLKEIKQNSQE